jgi:DUF1365 family protein
MDQSYQWWVSAPGEGLGIGFRNLQAGRARLRGIARAARREMDRRLMARVLRTYPPQTIATLARIYLHALRLRMRGAPWFAHPTKAA